MLYIKTVSNIAFTVCVSGYYYPYLNQMHYLSPIIWLQFRNLTPGVIIQIRWIHGTSKLIFAKIS